MEKRIRITIRGAVQGVGFRPFVYRLATSLGLKGWVNNNTEGVTIEAEGSQTALDQMLDGLQQQKPPYAYYEFFDIQYLDPAGFHTFEIKESLHGGDKRVMILPDIATCPECLNEIFDPENRRHLYPFTNCTHCGPRYSIITGLPYDREQTTMAEFIMCDHCRQEYEDPENRRFHAQPNACPECGPQMELWDADGNVIAHRHEAMILAADAIKAGKILALKGLGGFQLLTDVANDSSVRQLRKRKNREEKPFALMTTNLEQARELCEITKEEEHLLGSPQAPIVILRRKKDPSIQVASSVAPGHPTLGIMLPYTPIHHILMRLLDSPVVATSGNLSDEPICTDEYEALDRLKGIADLYLVHNRPVERHVDDSVVRIIAGKPVVLRRARGFAPLPVSVKPMNEHSGDEYDVPAILALGGHMKNTIAINNGNNIFLSQYIGDLDTYEAVKAYHKVVDDLPRLYDQHPAMIIHDSHPDYYSSKDASKYNLPEISLQHHYAHILSCMAEHRLEGPVLGVAWDGTGFGTDKSIWGGEFIISDVKSWKRIATFRKFHLPGGDKAAKEPRRSALGVLYEILGDQVFKMTELPAVSSFSDSDIHNLEKMLKNGINAPVTTSAGRLFDAVASLLNIYQKISYEGQAAITLEHLIPQEETKDSYPYGINSKRNLWIIDWGPMIQQILRDITLAEPSQISAKFHNTLSDIIVDVALRSGEEKIVLSGGCFQNVYLTEHTIKKLKKFGFIPYWHQQIPTNDGGIAAGQLYYALCNADTLIEKQVYNEVPG